MYIENNVTKNQLSFWLSFMFWIISLMIVIGGLTRLTDSGLSITQWELFSGLLPPLNEHQWIDWNFGKSINFNKIDLKTGADDDNNLTFLEYKSKIINSTKDVIPKGIVSTLTGVFGGSYLKKKNTKKQNTRKGRTKKHRSKKQKPRKVITKKQYSKSNKNKKTRTKK